MKHISYLVFFLFLSFNSFAQIFGGNPSSIKWRQINTDSIRVIFPVGMDSQAQRVASIVHYLAAQKPASLGNEIHKINIVLQNQTTIANGYVGLSPYRSEFFLTPMPDNFQEGSISWADQLAVHEYRHVQQFNNFHNGLSQVMFYLFGEDGFALATNASIPDWFYEGDAVYNETITTNQGRGRLPLFLNAYPSLWQAGKNYSWMKLRNGSLKDYVPNHYYLGYMLVNYGREKYGTDFWAKVTHDASAYKGLFYPFQTAIKKYAGIDYKTFYTDAFKNYKDRTAAVTSNAAQTPTAVLAVNKNYVTSYYFPYNISTDSLLYLRTSYRHRPAFFIKTSSGEHKLKVRDIAFDEQFSYKNGKIVYAGYESDTRWGWRDYSVIKVLDVQTGKQQTITHKTKYFTPDISGSGSKIAAVSIAPGGKSELHILDTGTGEIVNTIHSTDVMLYTDPKFIDENILVTAVRLQDGKMALALVDVAAGSTTRLTPLSFNVVGYPSVDGDNIYYTASYGGNDDVFMIRLSDKKIFRISQGPQGNYFVNASAGKLTWSAFTAEGYQLKQMNQKDVQLEEISTPQAEELKVNYPVNHSNEFSDILLNTIPQRNFAVSKYKKGTRLLNFHSWRPYYEDPYFTFSLYGENILNTLQTELYYLYNKDEKTSAVGFNTVYGAFFPYLSAGVEYTFNRQDILANKPRTWDQLDTRIGLNIPLSFAGGQTFRNFNIGTNYVVHTEFNKGFFKDSIGTRTLSYLHHYVTWSQYVQQAVQHIYPRLGYSLSLNHRYTVGTFDAYQFITSGALYLPGFVSNHNIILTGSFQQRDTLRAFFGSAFANARGYADYYRTTAGSRMWRLSVNYHLPIWHPDWGFANILYIQRFRANVFYDIQRLYSNNKLLTADLRSTGIEVYADTRWWNQYPLTFGFRVSHLLDNDPRGGLAKGSNFFEFIVPISIIPK